jgi:arylsulfatase A-like enzyme
MNFLVIVSDTLRRDALGCYGNPTIRTPNLDRFAEQALVFDRAYINSFGTVPARRDIFTGRATATYSVWSPLPREEVVLADVLGRNGYVSMMITDTPHTLENGYHYDRGFTGWEWIRGQESDRWRTDPDIPVFPAAKSKLRSPDHLGQTHLRNISDRQFEADFFAPKTMITASRWLERHYGSSRPFLLYVDTFDPHEPWDAPQWYVDSYDPGYVGDVVTYPRYARSDYLSDAELNHVRALYAAEVTMVDRWVGHLLQRLEDTGQDKDTAVIICSDHGFLHGEHGYIGKSLIGEQGLSALPLWEEIAGIPFMVRMPGGRTGRSDALVQLWDIMPTVLDMAGAPVPDTVQGRSIAPLLRGETDHLRAHALSFPFLVVGGYGGVRVTVTTDRWSYISSGQPHLDGIPEVDTYLIDGLRKGLAPVDDAADELYDLTVDPRQQNNIVDAHPDVAKELRLVIQQELRALQTRPEIVDAWAQPYPAA